MAEPAKVPVMTTTHQQRIANVLAVYDRAGETDRANRVWYEAAHTFCVGLSRRYNVSIQTAAAVVAVLSPRLEWGLNMRYAELYLETGDAPTFFSTKAKLARIMAGETLDQVQKGRKVAAFYDNIVNPTTSRKVTIDRHAYDIAEGLSGTNQDRKALDRKGVYDEIEAAYVEAAAKVGILPHELQAVVWVAHKRSKVYASATHQQFARKGAMA